MPSLPRFPVRRVARNNIPGMSENIPEALRRIIGNAGNLENSFFDTSFLDSLLGVGTNNTPRRRERRKNEGGLKPGQGRPGPQSMFQRHSTSRTYSTIGPGLAPGQGRNSYSWVPLTQLFNQQRTAFRKAKKAREQLQTGGGDAGFSGAGMSTEGLNFSVQGNASSARGMSGVMKYRDLAERAARETGVPAALILAVMGLESGGNPNAGSVAGAQGLMQVMPNYWSSTAQQVAGSSNLRDPWVNVRTGAEVLKQNKDRWGTWENAVKAYLAGTPHSTSRDAYGTGVNDYAQIIAHNIAWLQQRGVGQPKRTEGYKGQGGYVFPVEGYSGGLSLHWGSSEGTGAIDLFAPRGTPVRAITGGQARSGYSDIGGYWTMITGDDGLKYYYAHQDRMGPNGRIEAGGYIGGVGDTGNAKGTGAHLHLGIGNTIYTGTGPRGGAGDLNVINFLRSRTNYNA